MADLRSVGLEAYLDGSPSLRKTVVHLARAAASEAPILILGEAGTGRSTLARALHAESSRAAEPLVEVDLAAVPITLFESELFGYRAGAFTGAGHDRDGRVAAAEGGTLVLDHVEGMPHASQPKLLRLLAEGRFAPLGGDDTAADVRYMAIGPPDLGARAAAGTFRGDLYYRLEVLAVQLPPLRHRLADVPSLAQAFLADLSERLGRSPFHLSERSASWMAEYRWAGNLTELRNVLERAAIVADGAELDPAPPRSLEARPESLARVEEVAIRKALAFTGGHQGRAARLLGISRKTLWQKRRTYGIP